MRTSIVFVLGLLLGSAVATGSQESKVSGLNLVNHVGIAVDNFDDAMNFYTQKMGFRQVFMMKNDKGDPTLAFVQVSKDTFLEIAPANANRPAGLTHFGINVDSASAVAAALKARGVTVSDPRSVGTEWTIANVTAPGTRIELTEVGPGSPLGQASSSWK